MVVQKDVGFSDRVLSDKARLSSRTLNALRRNQRVQDKVLFALAEAAEDLWINQAIAAAEKAEAFALLQQKRAELESDAALAAFLEIGRSYVTRPSIGRSPFDQHPQGQVDWKAQPPSWIGRR